MATATAARAPEPSAIGLWRRVLSAPLRLRTWGAALYVALAFPLGLCYCIGLAIGLGLGMGLLVLIVGLPILVITIVLAMLAAELERGLAKALLGARILRPASPPAGVSLWGRIQHHATDATTWKTLLFLGLKLPVGVVCLALGGVLIGPAIVLLAAPVIAPSVPILLIDWEIDGFAEGLLALPLGLGLVIAAAHMARGMGFLLARLAEVMLGPRKRDLIEQVDAERESRVRMIAAADAERRRIERDLHDGAQQRIVALGLALAMAERTAERDAAGHDAPSRQLRELIAGARREADAAVSDLRALAQGIHPTILTERGLGPALEQVAERAPVPVEVTGVPAERLPETIEATVYFVVSEALTNMAKHARASAARVDVVRRPRSLCVQVADDGVGGADPRGSGLRGLADRVSALGGVLEVDSPQRDAGPVGPVPAPAGGTRIHVEIPLPHDAETNW